ncbi:hypothetical protein CGSMWGv1500E_03564 [Gardnerella vaginalis 1500E]|uniref:TIGR04076 family protein n=2 Tax=Bifidobacteriaceae TaxID=31953 RepID=I4M0A3_GARVA|nr:hypothetical protein CGSMWGv1500E_03564 [Gardnerella vaginalis 1500E]
MHGWTNDERMMIPCCKDGTRPVIFKIEWIDIPETNEEQEWMEKQNFKNSVDDACEGLGGSFLKVVLINGSPRKG